MAIWPHAGGPFGPSVNGLAYLPAVQRPWTVHAGLPIALPEPTLLRRPGEKRVPYTKLGSPASGLCANDRKDTAWRPRYIAALDLVDQPVVLQAAPSQRRVIDAVPKVTGMRVPWQFSRDVALMHHSEEILVDLLPREVLVSLEPVECLDEHT